MKKLQLLCFTLFFSIGIYRYLWDTTGALKSYDPFLKISNIDYYNAVYYKENWAKRKVIHLGNTTLTIARMYSDQFVAVVDLPDGPPTVTRGVLHRAAPGAIRGVPGGSKAVKLQLGDDTCKVRTGTALLTSSNFRAPNSWHQMVSFHSHWQAQRTVLGDKKVDYLVLSTEGKYSITNTPYSEAYHIFYRDKFLLDNVTSQCYKRIIFTDLAPHRKRGWVGGMWNLAGYNGAFHDTMKAHPRYVLDYRMLHRELLKAVDPRAPRKSKTLCYMKRKVGGTRGFQSIRSEKTFIELFKPLIMDFSPGNPPVDQQVRSINQCTTITGIHGAGLGYMIWADPGLNVVELGDNNICRGYYKHMAKLLGHSYVCVGIGSLASPNFSSLLTSGVLG